MISLRVSVTSGHYKMPGQVEQGGLQATFPVAPPSCIRGFLESLVGARAGTFAGAFAYGLAEAPGGRGLLLRRAHVLSSAGVKGTTKGAIGEAIRTVKVETLFDLNYRVLVRGSWEPRVHAALEGRVARFGVLSLGESQDIVTWIAEVPEEAPAQWVVPGTQVPLIVRSGRGYDRISPTFGAFDFGVTPSWFVEAA